MKAIDVGESEPPALEDLNDELQLAETQSNSEPDAHGALHVHSPLESSSEPDAHSALPIHPPKDLSNVSDEQLFEKCAAGTLTGNEAITYLNFLKESEDIQPEAHPEQTARDDSQKRNAPERTPTTRRNGSKGILAHMRR